MPLSSSPLPLPPKVQKLSRIKQPSGRLSVPYVMLFYLPVTCNAELRMLYAGAKELMRNTAEVSKVLELDSAEELEELPGKLGAAE